jgi:hypothetical protein
MSATVGLQRNPAPARLDFSGFFFKSSLAFETDQGASSLSGGEIRPTITVKGPAAVYIAITWPQTCASANLTRPAVSVPHPEQHLADRQRSDRQRVRSAQLTRVAVIAGIHCTKPLDPGPKSETRMRASQEAGTNPSCPR